MRRATVALGIAFLLAVICAPAGLGNRSGSICAWPRRSNTCHLPFLAVGRLGRRNVASARTFEGMASAGSTTRYAPFASLIAVPAA